jgi:hypothetical protein
MANIGVPSVRGMKDAFVDFGYGAIGGGVYGIGKAILGNGVLGAVGAPVIAGSILKGDRGKDISTIAGFIAGAELLGAFNSGASAQPAAASSQESVM